MNLSKEMFMRMGIATLLIPLVITFILYQFNFTSFLVPVLVGKFNIAIQVLIGIAGGGCMILLAFFMSKWEYLNEVQSKFTIQLGGYQLTLQEIVFLSFCAGFGEEILFRGMLQPWLGIFFTAFLFIALHGYISVKSSAHLIFGLALWSMGIGLGLLGAYSGLISAAIAHMIYDIYAFLNIQREFESLKSRSKLNLQDNEQEEI
ncbi:MAG: lysostaphin resistance A-like protein [Bacteroidota bacterium]|nr:CPBP family intramembrane metalloprotease [Bacteroidota bacterium]